MKDSRAIETMVGGWCLFGLFSVAAAQTLTMDFMPAGGKSLLIDVLNQGKSAALIESAGEKRNAKEWVAALEAMKLSLKEREVATLAGYLAVNGPFEANVMQNPGTGLPADGRELAWNGCQSCHSLFTGYLTQQRDYAGWQNMFQSPFHKELRMTERERNEFSTYSSINMPMKYEEVPEDLRF